jgi:hypothetical protein
MPVRRADAQHWAAPLITPRPAGIAARCRWGVEALTATSPRAHSRAALTLPAAKRPARPAASWRRGGQRARRTPAAGTPGDLDQFGGQIAESSGRGGSGSPWLVQECLHLVDGVFEVVVDDGGVEMVGETFLSVGLLKATGQDLRGRVGVAAAEPFPLRVA